VPRKKKFKFPEGVLGQINECSDGGFVLFTFGDDGEPLAHCQFDTLKDALAMQYHIVNWSKAVENLNIETTINQLSKPDKKSTDNYDDDSK
jgi:hypothetical protein